MRNLNLRSKLSGLASKKVPALSLILVAIAGMVGGVLAATMVVTQYSNTGIAGSYRNSTGTITVTDKGLAVVANSASTNITSTVIWGATGTDKVVNNALTAGNWMQYFEFTTSLTDSSSHTATITIRTGAGPVGDTTVATVTTGAWTAPGSSSSAKITVYVDLGVQSITAPLTAFVSVS